MAQLQHIRWQPLMLRHLHEGESALWKTSKLLTWHVSATEVCSLPHASGAAVGRLLGEKEKAL